MKSFDIKIISSQFELTADSTIAVFALDEVGRGPLAGPVVSGCIHVQGTLAEFQTVLKSLKKLKVNDSKQLSKTAREEIVRSLKIDLKEVQNKSSFHFSINGIQANAIIVEIDNEKIDEINILQASLESMRIAFENLYQDCKIGNSLSIVDGNKLFSMPKEVKALSIIEGDSKSLLIGLASILAKVYRDKLMERFDSIYPGYGFSTNAGYPSLAHREAIKVLGPTAIHRRTFQGVKEYAAMGTRK